MRTIEEIAEFFGNPVGIKFEAENYILGVALLFYIPDDYIPELRVGILILMV